MYNKLLCGLLLSFVMIDVTSSQGNVWMHYLRQMLNPLSRTIQIRRTAPVLQHSGLGRLIGHSLPQQQSVGLRGGSRPTLFTTNPSEDSIKRAAIGLGMPIQSVDVGSIDSSSTVTRIGPGGRSIVVDTPDRPDPIDVVYASRSMVGNARDAARLQRLTDSDAVILV